MKSCNFWANLIFFFCAFLDRSQTVPVFYFYAGSSRQHYWCVSTKNASDLSTWRQNSDFQCNSLFLQFLLKNKCMKLSGLILLCSLPNDIRPFSPYIFLLHWGISIGLCCIVTALWNFYIESLSKRRVWAELWAGPYGLFDIMNTLHIVSFSILLSIVFLKE